MSNQKVRPIRIEGNIAYLPLTRGYEAVVDASDVLLVRMFNWQAQVMPYTVYARRVTPRDKNGRQKTIYLHNALHPAPLGLFVDHADTNGLNCKRENLRHCTQAQNQQNRKMQSRNSTGFKGVSWNKAEVRWDARICTNGKRIFLGLFDSPQAASAAYIEARARLHGVFAR